MSILRHRTIVLLIFLVSMSMIGIISLTRRSCVTLSCLQMDGLAAYKLKDVYEDSKSSYRGLYQRGDELLRAEIRSGLDASDAQRRIDGQLAQIKSVYEKARAPYPGELSNAIECGKDFMPMYDTVQAGSLPISRVTAYLTDRLTYGACTGEQAVNRSMLALFYCPNTNQLYQLEFIAPVKLFTDRQTTYDAMLQNIRCR